MAFLNAGVLPLLALVGVPILLHLLFRRRFRRIEWGPMEYLRLTLRRNRRRIRLEHWLLLALRVLLVAAVVLAFARPAIVPGGWASVLGGGGRTSRLLVLDDSLSMGRESAGRTAFRRALDFARVWVEAVRSGDAVTIVVASAPDAPVVRDARPEDPAPIVAALEALREGHAAAAWGPVFMALEPLLGTSGGAGHEVTLVTDLRRAGWGPDLTQAAERWAERGAALRIVDVGDAGTADVAIVALESETAAVLAGVPVRLRALVRNGRDVPLEGVEARLEAAGRATPVILPRLEPGQTLAVPLSAAFDAPGRHPVEFSVPADALPGDDRRRLVLDVRAHLDVLAVDGEPGAGPFEGETDFFVSALAAGGTPVRVTRLTDAEWLAAPPADADLVVLANVAELPAARAAALERSVESGAGLMIFPGDQLDPVSYGRHAAGLLPGELERADDEPAAGLTIETLDGSPLGLLGRLAPAALARVSARRRLRVRPAEGVPEVRVLARWNDASGAPAVLERRRGAGRVVLWTVTADRAWSDWPVDPTYVLAMRETALACARGGADPSVTAGRPLRRACAPGEGPSDASVDGPDGGGRLPAQIEETPGAPPAIVCRRTSRAGFYTLRWKDARTGPQAWPAAVNPDPVESDLARIDDAEVLRLAGRLPAEITRPEQGTAPLRAGREVWRGLAWIGIAILLGETALVAWMARSNSQDQVDKA